MSKICFITMGNLYLCPYINAYIKNIEIDYDIIYWDRDNIEESTNARHVYKFSSPAKVNRVKNLFKKVWGYVRFYKYVDKILNSNNYEYIILLQTLAGMVASKTLLKKYKNKYVLDIRDYTFENNKLFYHREKNLITNSYATVISSKGFKSFLPDYNYIVTHNNRELSNKDLVNGIKNRNKKRDKLNIAFIGYISYQDQHKKLLTKLKNNPKFQLSFIGKESYALKGFSESNNIRNVKLIDKFPPEEILYHYSDVDLINNLYGNNTPVLDYALSNKLYFAAELHIPILVCPGTYMAKLSKEYDFGIEIDINNDNIAEKLYDSYQSIEWNILADGCDKFLEMVDKDNISFNDKIKEFNSYS